MHENLLVHTGLGSLLFLLERRSTPPFATQEIYEIESYRSHPSYKRILPRVEQIYMILNFRVRCLYTYFLSGSISVGLLSKLYIAFFLTSFHAHFRRRETLQVYFCCPGACLVLYSLYPVRPCQVKGRDCSRCGGFDRGVGDNRFYYTTLSIHHYRCLGNPNAFPNTLDIALLKPFHLSVLNTNILLFSAIAFERNETLQRLLHTSELTIIFSLNCLYYFGSCDIPI